MRVEGTEVQGYKLILNNSNSTICIVFFFFFFYPLNLYSVHGNGSYQALGIPLPLPRSQSLSVALSGSLTRQKFDAIHQEVYRFATVEAFDQEDQTDSEFLLICFVEVDLTCSQGEITNNSSDKTLFIMCSCSKCFSLFLELTISVLAL